MKRLLLLLPVILLITPIVSSGYAYASASSTATSQTTSQNTSSTCASYSQAKCSACAGIQDLGGSQNCASNGSSLTNFISTAVEWLTYFVGILAVIMIIVSGIKFALSGGDANSVTAAKKTLIYAIIGLLVAALTQVIIRLTLKTSTQIGPIVYIKLLL